MPKESGYYGTKGDLEKYQKRIKEGSKFNAMTGKWSPDIPIKVIVVLRTSAGWIKGKEHFNWQVGVFNGMKRWYGRGYNEVMDKKARQHAEGDADNLAKVLDLKVTCGKLQRNELVPL